MAKHAALYCRISVDKAGRAEGVRQQERAGRAYAARTWPGLPVEVYADNDLSAANGGPRPAFDRLRGNIDAGQVAHLWTVEQSRLERDEIGWFTLAAQLDAAGIGEVHTDRDGIVQVGGEVAGIKAVIAAGEARRLRRRVRDKLADNAAAGIPPPSRPYGLRHAAGPDGVKTYEHDPEQAAVVREAADRVLAGWSLMNIARDLTARGVRGVRGSKLNSTTVRAMLTTPAVAGLRLHQGRIIGRGNWTPILDEATWQTIRAKLGTTRTVTRPDGSLFVVAATRPATARRYLLTGWAYCGVCGARMVGALKLFRRGTKQPYYQCAPKFGGRGCVGALAVALEEHVRDRLLTEMNQPAFRRALAADDHAARRDGLLVALGKVDDDREHLAAEWGAEQLTAAEWQTARNALNTRQANLQAELAALPPPAGTVDPDAIAAAWPLMTLDERREIVAMFVERVTVGRARPPYSRFDTDRVRIDWR